MEKWEISIQHFKNLINEDCSKGSLEIMQQYFDDNVGMGEMDLGLVEIRGNWDVANTDTMSLMCVEDCVDEIIEYAKSNEILIEWLEQYYDNNIKPKVYKICQYDDFMLIKTNLSNEKLTKWCNMFIASYDNLEIINIFEKPYNNCIWEILGDTISNTRLDLEDIEYDDIIILG